MKANLTINGKTIKLTLTREQVKELQSRQGRWEPEYEEHYWFVGVAGDISGNCWLNVMVDKFRYSQRNVFKTKEEAQAHLDYLNAIAVIRDDAGDWQPDWNDSDQIKHCGYYVFEDSALAAGYTWTQRSIGGIYFENKEAIERSQNVHRKEWLIALGVGDES